MKMIRKLLLPVCLMIGSFATANNVTISNVVVADEVEATGRTDLPFYLAIQFDLDWENSWRLAVGPSNRDAVHVFAYYSEAGGPWTFLGNTTAINNAGFESSGFSGEGKLIYRSVVGSGDASLTGVSYRGGITDPNFDPNAEIEVRLFAVEMVLIPEGAFDLGQGSGFNSFNSDLNLFARGAYKITDEASITLSGDPFSTGRFLVNVDNSNAGPSTGLIPGVYPKGFKAFWIMKYEVSQQQYVDFFNTLTDAQKVALDPTGPKGKNTDGQLARNGCSWTSGDMTTTLPNVAMNFVNAEMIMAYLEWSGLRPMSEFEFEKAARGTRSALDNEYAWGTTRIATATYAVTDGGSANEQLSNLSAVAGNAIYTATVNFGGPARVGAVAGSTATPGREQSGASYYGVMDLSGNLGEFAISAGSPNGRAFADERGNYTLGVLGQTTQSSWPAPTQPAFAVRGGAYSYPKERLQIADRFLGTITLTEGTAAAGFRGAIRSGYSTQ